MEYGQFFFFDANLVFHARPLEELPWIEISKSSPILLIAVPQVLREVDSKKRDGRLAKRARAFFRLTSALAKGEVPIVEISPQVHLSLADCGPVDWKKLNLDPSGPDERLVGEAVTSWGGASRANVALLSADINPLNLARRHGIRPVPIPENWLLDAEPNVHEKEVLTLRSRLNLLEKSLPKVRAEVELHHELPLKAYRVQPLGASDRSRLRVALLSRAQPSERTNALEVINPFHSGYVSALERYRKTKVPQFVDNLHSELERLYSQFKISISVRNEGNVQAERLAIRIRPIGATLHEKFRLCSTHPPTPPKQTDVDPRLLRTPNVFVPARPGPHDFTIDSSNPEDIRITCEDFRSGAPWSTTMFVLLSPSHERSRLLCDVSCANRPGTDQIVMNLDTEFHSVEVSDLIDLDTFASKKDFPLHSELVAAVERQDYDWIDTDSDDD